MLYYLKAENLKLKRTFIKKLIFLAPVVSLLFTLLAPLRFFQANGFNWWYAFIVLGCVSLMGALADQKEAKKLSYRALFSLPISLKKVWMAKVLLISFYISVACLILLAAILGGGLFIPSPIPVGRAVAGMILIIITILWQIPFCLLLSRKLGMLGTILINFGAGTVLNFALVDKVYWWACPYCWTTRIMTPVLGILPNGMWAESGDALLNSASIPIGVGLSLLWFVVLLLLTANWFQKQEVK